MDFDDEDLYNPSFRPSLPDCGIRSRVPSSGYGKQLAKKPQPLVDPAWEPPVTFHPELPPNALREKVPSSGYGKVLITPTKREASVEIPEFKPKLNNDEIRKKVASSAYGKVVPKPSPKPSVVVLEHKLVLPKDEVREKVASSAYGKVAARPKTAPPKPASNGFTLDCVAFAANAPYSAPRERYSLLKDKGTPDAQDDERRRQSVSPIRTQSAIAQSLRERAPSALYGKVVAKKRDPPPPPEPPKARVAKTSLADKVASSGYGKVAPAVITRHEVPLPAPVWSPAKRTPSLLPPAERITAKSFPHVSTSGYGKVSPKKVERPEKPETPKWNPSSLKPKIEDAPLIKSERYDYVPSSGYASSDYVPPGIGREDIERYDYEEEGDYNEQEEHLEQEQQES